MSNDLNRSIHVLCLLSMLVATASAAQFTGLGDLPGGDFVSYALGVSDDGSVVVGKSKYGIGSTNYNAFRWTETGGMQTLNGLPTSGYNSAEDVSADGSVVVGYAPWGQAFRWTQATGMRTLGTHTAHGVSADGSVVVGRGTEGYRWTEAGGVAYLDTLPNRPDMCHPMGVSGDGSTVVGYDTSSSGLEAFRWTEQTGMQPVGTLPHGRYGGSQALDASPDGLVVVGDMFIGGGDREAFRWSEGTGLVGLGDLPGDPFFGSAYGVTGDGSVVVGTSNGYYWDPGSEAFIWDANNGMRRLQDVLTSEFDLGPSLEGWTLRGATAISPDGRVIVGCGVNPLGQTEAWRAIVPEPSTLVGLINLATAGLLAYARRRKR